MSEDASRGRPQDVPSVTELRPIAQGSKTQADRRWSYRAFRAISIYLTWALLHTRVTPNQVTVASLVIAAFGLVMVALPGALAIGGCLLLLVYHLLDRVDGELARYQRRYSLLGVYLDNAGHYLTGAGILIAASFHLSEVSSDPRVTVLIGALGAIISMMARIEKHAAFHLFGQYVLESPGLVDTVSAEAGSLTKAALDESRADGSSTSRTPLAMLGGVLLTLSWFPISVLILMAGFVAEAVGFDGTGLVALYIVVGLQTLTYAGVELANLTGNLGSESKRLARRAGLVDEE